MKAEAVEAGIGAIFNRWRKNYDTATDTEMIDFYNDMYGKYPHQGSYHLDSVKRFLKGIDEAIVFEFGGWKGDLAKAALPTAPNVSCWHNYDCCHRAIDAARVLDQRYEGHPAKFHVWDEMHDVYNTLIAAHAIEHIKEKHLRALLKALPDLTEVYFDAPLGEHFIGLNWDNYEGTHIYEHGWLQVLTLMKEYGFTQVGHEATGTALEPSRAYWFHRDAP